MILQITEAGAPGLALFHYREALPKDHERALTNNNAGIAAATLSLPITARTHQKKAAELGSTLAMSNLASAFLEGGFVDEAKELLTKARETTDVDRRIDSVAGDIATAERREEQRLEEIFANVKKGKQWRLKHAEALVAEQPPITEILGEYEGTSRLVLSLLADGTIAGTFALPLVGEVVLTGRLEGRALSFAWATNPPQPASWASTLLGPTRNTGHGLLILEGARLRGYALSQPRLLDLADLKDWKDLDFQRRASGNLLPAPTGS